MGLLNEFLELGSRGEQLKVTYCKEDRESVFLCAETKKA